LTSLSHGISFVVPHHNQGRYLLECIESIRKQRLGIPYEIIVVDDGSDISDVSLITNSLRGKLDIRVLENVGKRSAQRSRNIGVSAARFDYILPIDADDMLKAYRPEAGSYPDLAVSILAVQPECGFVHTGSDMFGAVAGLTISSYPLTEQLVAKKHHVPIGIVFRRKDFLAGARYDEEILKWQDWSFGVDLLASRIQQGEGTEIAFIKGAHYLYRIHESSQRISKGDEDELAMVAVTVRRRPEFFDKWYSSSRGVDLARSVLSEKPSKLTDLLFMASYDLCQALAVVRERRADLRSAVDELGVP
jgi:glycosyltransferase involved in cell wall biosynthesis